MSDLPHAAWLRPMPEQWRRDTGGMYSSGFLWEERLKFIGRANWQWHLRMIPRCHFDPSRLLTRLSIPMPSIPAVALSIVILLSACSGLRSFRDVDANQDGGVSPDEAAMTSEDLASLFDTADEDRDGVLNEEEYEFVRAYLLKGRTSTHRGPPRRSARSGGGHSH